MTETTYPTECELRARLAADPTSVSAEDLAAARARDEHARLVAEAQEAIDAAKAARAEAAARRAEQERIRTAVLDLAWGEHAEKIREAYRELRTAYQQFSDLCGPHNEAFSELRTWLAEPGHDLPPTREVQTRTSAVGFPPEILVTRIGPLTGMDVESAVDRIAATLSVNTAVRPAPGGFLEPLPPIADSKPEAAA